MSGPSVYLGGSRPIVMYNGVVLGDVPAPIKHVPADDSLTHNWYEHSAGLCAADDVAASNAEITLRATLPRDPHEEQPEAASTACDGLDTDSDFGDYSATRGSCVSSLGPVSASASLLCEGGGGALAAPPGGPAGAGRGERRGAPPSLEPPRAPQATAGAAAAGRTRRARHTRKMIERSSGLEDPGKITTMMVSNLPLRLQRSELMDMLDGSGFDGVYDFCYVPSDFHSGMNNGHAFINFHDHGTAVRFKEAWHAAAPFRDYSDSQTLRVVPARIQGLRANAKMASVRMNVRNPKHHGLVSTKDQSVNGQ
ncbi:unnamed protein product [Prorocentrum cordatum]|uniref:RRM domain-containing protein n=1 Tax=Prorocentrum cordatum TaxID=2364126 RepID=A0ABN9Q5F9_9DINO|nr:unnamed protein product [Polarella glacialis]